MTCGVDGCDRRHRARGMCERHYHQARHAARQEGRCWHGLDVDEMAVQRFVEGDPPDRFGFAERREAVRILTEQGLSARLIAARIGVSSRQVVRDRRRVGVAA